MVAKLLRLMRQVVRVNANKVAANQTRAERQEVPFRASRLQDFQGIDADLVENDRKFIHQRNIQVTLRVFDNLCSFGNLNAGGRIDAGGNNASVNLLNFCKSVRCVSGNNLDDLGDCAFFIAWVDAFRRITHEKVFFPGLARFLLKDRNTNLFCSPRVDGGLVYNDGALLEIAANCGGRTNQWTEVGLMCIIDRCGNSYYDKISVTKCRCVRCYS